MDFQNFPKRPKVVNKTTTKFATKDDISQILSQIDHLYRLLSSTRCTDCHRKIQSDMHVNSPVAVSNVPQDELNGGVISEKKAEDGRRKEVQLGYHAVCAEDHVHLDCNDKVASGGCSDHSSVHANVHSANVSAVTAGLKIFSKHAKEALKDIQSHKSNPFDPLDNRSSWHGLQRSCTTLRSLYGHLSQGTIPSPLKCYSQSNENILTYLSAGVKISDDGLLVVEDKITGIEKLVIPSNCVNGVATAVHKNLHRADSSHSFIVIMGRFYYAIKLKETVFHLMKRCSRFYCKLETKDQGWGQHSNSVLTQHITHLPSKFLTQHNIQHSQNSNS